MSDDADEPNQPVPDAKVEFETQRALRIQQNRAKLNQLALSSLANQVFLQSDGPPGAGPSTSTAPPQPPRRQPAKRAPAPAPPPQRKSARMARRSGEGPSSGVGGEEGEDGAVEASGMQGGEEEQGEKLYTQEEYLALQGLSVPADAIRTDSHFRGWVAPDMCEQYGIAANASEAWESEGGGRYTHKVTKADIPAHLRKSGWSTAKAHAATQLRKNPNVFFFRHVAPHCQQAKGPWTPEEHQLFLDTARKYGCGDKWGLFASYIATRVGYQCRAYHTQVILPQGLVLDSQFRLTRSGEAIWVGRSGRGDQEGEEGQEGVQGGSGEGQQEQGQGQGVATVDGVVGPDGQGDGDADGDVPGVRLVDG